MTRTIMPKPWWRFGQYWLPVLVWMTAIIVAPYFIFLPLPVGDEAGPALRFELVRFSIHVTEYAVLCVLLIRAFAAGPAGNPSTRIDLRSKAIWLALAITIAFGAADEIQQGFAPNRQPSLWDLFGDASGGALVLAGIVLTHRRQRSRPTA